MWSLKVVSFQVLFPAFAAAARAFAATVLAACAPPTDGAEAQDRDADGEGQADNTAPAADELIEL